MKTRNQKEVIQNHSIVDTFQGGEPTKESILKTLQDIPANAKIINLLRYADYVEPGFGSMSDEKVWSTYWYLVSRSYRLENDEEYFARMKQEEDRDKATLERERNDYIRLKAKFEPETQIK